MKRGISSSICIIVAIVLVNCQIYPDVIAQWNRTGPIIIKHGCPTTARTEELAASYFDCIYYCKNSTGHWMYGFYIPGTNCSYGPERRPGSCFGGHCYLITDTVTEATTPDITQRPQVEHGTTPTPPVENDTDSTPSIKN
ncbi:uncharacterized protein LOC115325281 [Ixodes scapularis]|uniref:uncharacterized protein LOC115325281 n=1 Tax=Ixodes scapularis TaxID=6945 RepID=UPI001A9EFAAF|nr:uncharacterized protein LOC115325281 [Ixodes scapularis]